MKKPGQAAQSVRPQALMGRVGPSDRGTRWAAGRRRRRLTQEHSLAQSLIPRSEDVADGGEGGRVQLVDPQGRQARRGASVLLGVFARSDHLRDSHATRCTEPDMAAAGQPAMRAAEGSGRWQREQTSPGRQPEAAMAPRRHAVF
jgi:hypothetical protein